MKKNSQFSENLNSQLEGIVPGLDEESAVSVLESLQLCLESAIALNGTSAVIEQCNSYMKSELRGPSLSSVLVGYLSRFSGRAADLCSTCISLLTPDTVACGVSAGKIISIEVLPDADRLQFELGDFYEEWTGCRVWPGAIALSRKLLQSEFSVSNIHVLELGSGIGLTGICALKAGAKSVTFTEYKQTLLDTCLLNAKRNCSTESDMADRVDGFLLDWEGFDANSRAEFQTWLQNRRNQEWIIVGSELIYEEFQVDWVLSVLEQLFALGASRGILCVMTKPSRTGVDLFIHRLESLSPNSSFVANIAYEEFIETTTSSSPAGIACIIQLVARHLDRVDQ